MEPTFHDFPARTVVGIGGNFISILSPERDNFVVIPKLWEAFCGRQSEIEGLKEGAPSLGCIVAPADVNPSGRDGECHYVACVEVTGLPAKVPEGMEVRVIPAGRYAVFVHRGKLDNLGKTMSFIYGTWLQTSGVQSRDAPELEFYGEKFDPMSEESEMEIGIPIQ